MTPPAEGLPADISIIKGDLQTGVVGRPLADSLIVRVTDSKDRPVQGQRVAFVFMAGGSGSLLVPDTAFTDADGRARARWQLGSLAGQQRVEARVLGTSPLLKATFNATALADVPDAVIAVKGTGQVGPVGGLLADSLAVLVADQFGNPIAGMAVAWSIPAGQGAISATNTVTGADGRSAVTRTLGPTAGTQTTTATVTGVPGSPVTFTHTATSSTAVRIVKLWGDNSTAPVGSRLTDSLVVQVQDAAGNGVPGRNVNWVITGGGGSVQPTSGVTDASGKAFTFWTLGTAAGPNTVTAAAAGLPQVTFSATASPAQPAQIAAQSTTSQVGTAGQPVTSPPSVRVADSNNNPVQGVTVTFLVTAGGGTVADATGSGTTVTVATSATGIATLTSWTLGATAGPNTVTATATGSGIAGNPVTFSATGQTGAAARLVYVQGPSSVIAGQAISPAITVEIQDAGGNRVTSATNSVTIALGSNPGSGTLGGTKTVAAVGGIATFSSLTVDKAATGYTLAASATGLSGATSGTFNVSPASPSVLAFVQQPTAAAAGAVITPPVTVAIQDPFGNTVTTSSAQVTLALGANPSGASLGGTLVQAAAAGVATFANLTVDKSGNGYTLAATSTNLTGAASSVFSIGAGTPTKLAFVQQPTTTAAGAAITPAVAVAIQDANGNTVTSATDNVTLALGNNPAGATLSGTKVVAAVGGVATFAGVSLDKVGTGYTLLASSGSYTGATSSAFDVTVGTGLHLVFGVQPASATAGSIITPAVVVRVEDAVGNVATTFGGSVTVAIGTNPAGGTLSGTKVVSAVSGVATFADLSIDKAGAGYTLTADGGGLPQVTSASFGITPGAASQLVFTGQPSDAVAGTVIAPPVQVAVQDALGNTVTSAATAITVAIGTNPPNNGKLSGTKTVNAVSGVATFSNLSIDKAGVGYTLTADGGSLPQAVSVPFTIQTGSGNKLEFLVQPSNATVGTPIAPAIQVAIQDAGGNTILTATDSIRLSLFPTAGGLGGTVGARAVAGVATFGNVTVANAGTGYTLTAFAPVASPALLTATSTAFDVTLSATTTTITSDTPDPTVTGQGYTVSFNVTSAGGTPTGSVTVSDGVDFCVGALASGAGSCGLTSTSAGAKTLVAVYSGTTNFAGSSSAGAAHTVNKGTPLLQITSDIPDSSVTGQPVTVTWLTGFVSGSGTLTGNVTVADGSGASCSAPVAAGSCGLTLPLAGNRTLTASYPGDANFNGANDSEAHRVGKASTTTTTGVVSPSPASFGETVTVNYAVSVNAPGAGTPTGNVTVSDGAGASCIGTVAAGSCILTPTSAGIKTLTVTYPSDANYLGSSATGTTLTVNAAATSTVITADTPDPSPLGSPIAVTVAVTTNTGAIPAGSVLVSDDLGATCSIASLTSGGGTCNLTPTAAGTRTLTAAYTASSGNFTNSVSVGVTHTVSAAASTTTITADTPDPSVTGGTVAVSVAVTGSGGTPTGTVTVGDGTVSCQVTLAGGTGSCNLTFATAGARTLTASYSGDANFGGSSDTEAHTVSAASTTTSISGSSPDPSTVGQAYTVSYTVSAVAPGAGTPTGNVTVSDGTAQCVGTAAAGSCSLTSTTAGGKTLTASYAGDANFTGSVSVGVGHTVNQASTTTAITGSSPNPSSVSQAYTVSFTVTSGGGTPTGNVTVSDGTDSCVGTAAAGSCALTSTTVGTKTLIATYAGDANFTGSVSAGVSHTVGSSGTTTAITSDTPDPTVTGEAYTVSFTVTATGGTPTGNVTVSDGTGDSCIGTVAAGSCSLTSTTAGAKTLTATYAGDGTFPGSVSAGVSHSVSQASTTTAITGHTPDPSTVNQAYTVSVAVAPSAPGTGTPTGTVNVSDGTAACQVTLAAGAGSCQLTSTTGGTKTLTATYAGDANFTGSVSPGVSHTVNLISTTTSITADTPDPSVVGQGYTVSFDVLPNGGTRGDTVEVSDGSATCKATANTGSCTLVSTTAGTKTLVATHLATATHATSVSAGVSHTVNQAATTTTITADNPDPSIVGQAYAVNFSVLATAPGAGTPTGNVTVTDGTDQCVGTVAAGTCSLTSTTAGAKTLTATYASDGNFATSQSAGVAHAVDPFGAPDAGQTTAQVPATGTVGVTTTTTVQLRDSFGNLITTSGGNIIAVSISSGPNAGATVTVTDNGDGTYTATYVPGTGGGLDDTIDITLSGAPISGSPYLSTVN